MPKLPNVSINLAKNRGASVTDRVIAFALTTGRVIVILTEVIALGAFLYRFTLDQSLAKLHDHITQEIAVVNLLKSNEATFRSLQARLSLASTLGRQGIEFPKYLSDIMNFASPDITINAIALAPDGIRLEATTQSVSSLSDFVEKLKAYGPVQSVSLDRISNQTQSAILTVSITALLKPQIRAVAQGGLQ